MTKHIRITISAVVPETKDPLDQWEEQGMVAAAMRGAREAAVTALEAARGGPAITISEPEIVEIKKPRKDRGTKRKPAEITDGE